MYKKLSLLFSVVLILSFVAGAEEFKDDWEIEPLDQPYSQNTVSNETVTLQLVNITTTEGDNPISEPVLEDDYDIEYEYRGEWNDLEWLNQGYWMAEFNVNHSEEINYSAMGTVDGDEASYSSQTDQPVYVNDSLNIGPDNVSILNDQINRLTNLFDPVGSGEIIEIQANVTDQAEDFVNPDNFYLQFHNGTEFMDQQELTKLADESLHNNEEVLLPLKENSSYVMNIVSEDETGIPTGSKSFSIKTLPGLEGEVTELQASSGCNNNSFFQKCESGADISTKFNITEQSAHTVNLSLIKENNTDEQNRIKHNEWEMNYDGEDSIYSLDFEIPDLNTTNYTNNLFLEYKAFSEDQTFKQEYEIDYGSFLVEDRSSTTAYQGSSHNLELLAAKPFSLKPYNHSRFTEGSVEVITPEGDLMEDIDLEDMSHDGELFSYEVDIPGDAEEGSYSLDISFTNIYNHTVEELSSGGTFSLEDFNKSFELHDDIEFTTDYSSNYTETFEVENIVETDIQLSTTVSGDIENITTIEDTVEVNDSETKDLEVEFEIEDVQERDGEIILEDQNSGYTSSIDVNISTPFYEHRDNNLAAITGSENWINVTENETGTYEREIDLFYFGEDLTGENDNVTLNISSDGEISDYLDHEEFFEMNNTGIFGIEYEVSNQGIFDGEIIFETDDSELVVNTVLDADIEFVDVGMAVTETLDIGYLPEGESVTEEIDIENTGSSSLEIIGYTSNDFEVTGDEVTVEEGSTETVTISFESVNVETGTLQVEAESAGEDISETVTVTASIIDNFDQRVQQIQDDIIDLTAQATDQETQSQLQDLELEISDVQSDYDSENYEDAYNSLQEIESQIETISAQIGEEENGDEEFTPDPGETETGSSIPWIPIGLVIFVLLVVGIVAYESIIPEEGDPLYNVLGK